MMTRVVQLLAVLAFCPLTGDITLAFLVNKLPKLVKTGLTLLLTYFFVA